MGNCESISAAMMPESSPLQRVSVSGSDKPLSVSTAYLLNIFFVPASTLQRFTPPKVKCQMFRCDPVSHRSCSFFPSWSPSFGQYRPRTWFSPLPPSCGANKELLYPCGLMWVSPGLFVGAYPLGPPVPLSLCSCAMAPMVKATKPTATAAATFVSIDSFIRFFPRLCPRSIWSSVPNKSRHPKAVDENDGWVCGHLF